MKTEQCDDSETDCKDDSINGNEMDSDNDDDTSDDSSGVDSSEDELMQKHQQLLNAHQASRTDLGTEFPLKLKVRWENSSFPFQISLPIWLWK